MRIPQNSKWKPPKWNMVLRRLWMCNSIRNIFFITKRFQCRFHIWTYTYCFFLYFMLLSEFCLLFVFCLSFLASCFVLRAYCTFLRAFSLIFVFHIAALFFLLLPVFPLLFSLSSFSPFLFHHVPSRFFFQHHSFIVLLSFSSVSSKIYKTSASR